jgi:CTP:molybdopterin cytidylyltransferase MocA
VRVACAILAAGASRRLGRPKQTLLHRGQPLVVSAAECACQSRAAACAVVVGAHGGAVRAALGELPIEILNNEAWSEGVASSIRVAVRWAQARKCYALVIALCDQPKLSATHLDRLISEFERTRLPVASFYARKNAAPALFPGSSFDELNALCGDVGASALLNDGTPVASVPWPEGEFDVDTADAERRLQSLGGASR